MKGILTKKLPAALLAVIMVASLIPTALAADCGHNNWSSWQKLNDAQHQRKCLTSGCPGTQEANHGWSAAYDTDATSHWKKCADCGAQTTHESHTYNGSMKYDASNHWDQCTVCGYKDNLGGHVDLNNDGKCDTCGYSTGTTNITVTFINGTKSYQTQNLKRGTTPSNPGTPTKSSSSNNYTFKGWTLKDPGTAAIYDGQTYFSSAEVAKKSLSSNTTYYALFTKGSGELTWKVKPGKELKFDDSDLEEIFDDKYSDDNFRYVVFEADSSLKTSNGTLYFNRGSSDAKTFTKNDLEDYDFYYSKSKYGDYALSGLSFVADSDAKGKTVSLDFTLYGDDEELEGTLEIEISSSSSSKNDEDITYKVDVKDDVSFDRSDFKELFDDEYDDDDTFRYVTFSPDSSYKSSNGYLYYDYDGKEEEKFTKSELEDNDFYYSSSKYGDYPLDQLSFVSASDSDGETVTLDFTLYGDDEKLEGTLEILIGSARDDDDDDDDDDDGDITYTVDNDGEADLDRSDFSKYYKEDASGTIRYVRFYPDSSYKSADGSLYCDYDDKDEEEFNKTDLEEAKFYYSSSEYGDYALSDLTFVADKDFDEALSIDFRIYDSKDEYVKGTMVIKPAKSAAAVSGTGYGNIRYYITTGTALQINANDVARFLKKQFPGNTLQYVELIGVPSTGALYYNYYSSSSRQQLTAGNCDDQRYYLSPSSNQYDLSQLTYIPSGSNYCASIPFTATGVNSKSVQGSILISVTRSAISEVYGVTPKNTAVSLPASAIYSAVYSATGTALSSIQLLTLPASNVGTVNISGGYVSLAADTSTRYGYSTGTQQMNQLKFVPANGYTGAVEIPYVAYDSAGNTIASGKFCLGVVNNLKRFSDVTSSTWCYKYVTELSDAGVIGGYSNGSFRADNTVTYGAALKLIMLAAGYSEQAPTGKHTFSGYLSRAQADGLVSGSVNLDSPITRLQVSQLAAKAMKLSITALSANRPFTDTADVYVQALNAAGIVEGYFSNGASTFKPGNTLTRGQVSAIVWRMRNYTA